jgi:hypothetical protein
MIIFVVGCGHKYTHACLCEQVVRPSVSILSYDELWRSRILSRATYIFTDFDRLNFWELQLAALTYNSVARAGWQPLNNPAQSRQRYALLLRLYDAGINHFGIYRVEGAQMPSRYPVFLRNECAHEGPLTGLLFKEEELQSAIKGLIAAGHPERHLLIIEYAAEPIRPNLYRKYTMYRMGDRVFPGTCVHEDTWMAKTGKRGIAGQELYDEENAMMQQNPHGDLLRRVFDIAQIEYGRADFGIVGEKVQIYEINTNPQLADHVESHPFRTRNESHLLFWQSYVDGLAAIDGDSRASTTDRVILSDPAFQGYRHWWASSESRRKTP